MSKGLNSIAGLLAPIFKNLGMEDRLAVESVRQHWGEIFKEPLSAHTCPVELNAGELVVNVDTPIWLQQLKFYKKDMVEKLRQYNVKSIRFKSGRVYGPKERPEFAGARQVKERPPLSDEETEWIRETVSHLEDPEVRERVSKAIESQMKKSKTVKVD